MNKTKKETIEKLQDLITKELKNVRFNNKMILEDKLDAVDVLYDTFKFLDRYEENVKILNQNRRKWENEK